MSYGSINPDTAQSVDRDKALDVIDSVFKSTPVGSISSAITDSFKGINHRLMPNAVPINKDHFGLTFFTRPMLNMKSTNLRQVRQLAPLLTRDSTSLGRVIRCTLDPSLATDDEEPIDCPIIDNNQAFIPILTNTLLSMSGWPDVEVPTYSSNEGVYKESYTIADGTTKNYRSYDIQANFRNVLGDPVTLLLLVWSHYMSAVFEGIMQPRGRFIQQNTIDYQTRIYRLVLDQTRTRVQKIAACGVAIPTAVPIGAAFNYEADRPINASNDQISVRFSCTGADYQDEILIKEFNKTVCMFNTNMKDAFRERLYRQVPSDALMLFNNKGYPRINPDNYNLEWWVPLSVYSSVMMEDDLELSIPVKTLNHRTSNF